MRYESLLIMKTVKVVQLGGRSWKTQRTVTMHSCVKLPSQPICSKYSPLGDKFAVGMADCSIQM